MCVGTGHCACPELLRGPEGDFDAAARHSRAALELAPESDELMFWAGLGRAAGGDLEGGTEMVRATIARSPGWAELLRRLEPDIAPAAEAVRGVLERSG